MRNLLLLAPLVLLCNVLHAQCGSGSYTEPQFTIDVQNPGCPDVGEIRVNSASGGVAPYTYTLTPGNVSNSSGVFTNLAPGVYTVQMRDACGNVRSRQATLSPYAITAGASYVPGTCGNFTINITSSVTGPRLEYGISMNGGSTINWGTSPSVDIKVSGGADVKVYVRDSCGYQGSYNLTLPREIMGYIKELRERIECFGQEIYPVYYGFRKPRVCLYKYPQRELVACKQAPRDDYTGGDSTNFFSLPFGQDYYVIVEDSCYRDSAFFRDKTSAGGSELNPFNWKCTTFDIHADGNNYDTVCLWNGTTNTRVGCKKWNDTAINPNTGKPWPYGGAEWYDLPYGHYYAYIFDPCEDTLIRVDTIVARRSTFTTQLNYTCSVVETAVTSLFGPESPRPHKTTVYYPDSTIAGTFIDQGVYLSFPTWREAGTLTVIQEDGCGDKDTSTLDQPYILPVRSLGTRGGCPGINGNSGGGDIVLSGSSLAYGGRGNGAPVATIRIISKDGTPVNIPQSHTEWNGNTQRQDFFFTNVTTGLYILESTIGCNGVIYYDTIDVKPYVYPGQGQNSIIQCGPNPYSFRSTTAGGVAPFTFEITNTRPLVQSLLTGPQESSVFSVPAGTNLDSITIQVVDACGNSNRAAHAVLKPSTCNPLDVDSVTGRPLPSNGGIRVYPNPSHHEFWIEFAALRKTDYRILLYNGSGVAVYDQTLRNIDQRRHRIAQMLAPGIYVIVVHDTKTNRQQTFKQVVL